MIDYAKQIKESVSMSDVVQKYVGADPKHNRIPCPFHNGKDNNLSFKDDMFKCFVCGEGGDIFRFTTLMFRINFNQAILKLNCDFGLNLPTGEKLTIRKKRELAKFEQKHKSEMRMKLIKRYAKEWKYWTAFDEWKRLSDNKLIYAPSKPQDSLQPLYCEALNNLEHQTYLLDIAEIERNEAIE